MSSRHLVALCLTAALAVGACSSDGTSTTPSSVSTSGTGTAPENTVPEVEASKPFPTERCEANKAAGPILYLSSFDYSASASIVEVMVAKSKGYYEELCLDVQLKPSFSTDNYPLVAANEAQFSSGGSFSEMVDFADANDAGYVALAVDGRTGIDELITKDGEVPTIEALKGTKIGVKGAITPSVKAMLAKHGLAEGTDYETVLLDGFDPKVHIVQPGIVGFPGYKSNEPKQLEAVGIPFKAYDPSDDGIPGSFGIIYTNLTFLTEFPTAAEDFMRATMKGLADAVADPKAAAQIAVDAINANGNALYLTPDGEQARWDVESALVSQGVTADSPLGLPLVDQLKNEVDTYASIGLFDGVAPDISTMADPSVLKRIYDATGTVIWPN